MDKETTPRFSHITIGGAVLDEPGESEETEEVTVIGAVGLHANTVDIVKPVTRDSSKALKEGKVDRKASSKEKSGSSFTDKPDDKDDPEESMPFIQKIVIIVCGIGFLVVIAYLIWHWMIQR